MFQFRHAIITLITDDPTATDAEKSAAISAIAGVSHTAIEDGEVVSFARAAQILGYRSTKGVRKALKAGVLKGYYGGKQQKRCTGIVRASIDSALKRA